MDQITKLLEIDRIKTLRSLFSHYFDSRDLDGLLSLFASDAVCEFPAEFGGDWRGEVALRNNFRFYLDSYDNDWATIHAITNHVVTLHSDCTATGCCYLLDYVIQNDKSPLYAIAVFNDRYSKLDDEWRIQHSSIDFIWRASSAQ